MDEFPQEIYTGIIVSFGFKTSIMPSQNNSLIYLNNPATGLISKESIAAAEAFQKKTMTNCSGAFFEWMRDHKPALRKRTAELLKAKESQIAFVPNFSYGLLAAIHSMQPDINKVLLFKDDYPSLNMPFVLSGFDISYVDSPDGFEVPMSKIMEIAEKEKPQLIALSHVQFLSGFTLDYKALAKFCRERDIWLIIDFTQSMGITDLEFENSGIDVAISSTYKWLNGGFGAAVMAVSDRFMKRFPPKGAGFGSVTQDESGWTYTPSISGYEPGHLAAATLLQLEESLKTRLKMGVKSVREHNLKLLKRIASRLEETQFSAMGGPEGGHLLTLLCFTAPKAVHEHLVNHQIVSTWRKGAIRVGPHFYNTEEEVDILIDVLKKFRF